MFENVFLGIIGFLTTAGILGGLLIFIGSKLREYVKSTETKIDDEVLDSIVRIGQRVLDEKDLGKFEEELEKLLEGMKELPEDTEELEGKVSSALNNLKK